MGWGFGLRSLFHKNKRNSGGPSSSRPSQHPLSSLICTWSLYEANCFVHHFLKLVDIVNKKRCLFHLKLTLTITWMNWSAFIKNPIFYSKSYCPMSSILSVSHWIWNGLWLYHPILPIDKKLTFARSLFAWKIWMAHLTISVDNKWMPLLSQNNMDSVVMGQFWTSKYNQDSSKGR